MYLRREEIVEVFYRLRGLNKNINAFIGFLIVFINSKRLQDRYYSVDMRKVQDQLDKIIPLAPVRERRPIDDQWFLLLPDEWPRQIQQVFFNNKKVSATDFAVLIFWMDQFNSVQELVGKLRSWIADDVFFDAIFESDFRNLNFDDPSRTDQKTLFGLLGGTTNTTDLTFSFSGSSQFLNKSASDISAGSYLQTLYSNREFRKCLLLVDFDFSDRYSFGKKGVVKNFDVNDNEKIILSKPFILLAGVSGTGKTRFVRHQAETVCNGLNNYMLIPVRPDWHEPSDLLGYVSRIPDERYLPTPFLKFMVAAWCDAFDKIDADKIVLRPLDEISTFWACLDEMNLAPVEQYFADYLAVLETRKWNGDSYTCDALVHPARLLEKDTSLPELQKSLGLEGKDALWSHFLKHGIPLPPNLIVAGTVNMDETTHGFSRKVIDRAFTIDFGEFFPNDFDKFFTPDRKPKALQFSRYSKATQADLASVSADVSGNRSVEFLKAINEPLQGTPFELAYRALNELLLAVKCFAPANEEALEAVWDDFLMTKLLPRIEGDAEKLRADGEKSLLTSLQDKVTQLLPKTVATGTRPDLLQTDTAGGAVQVPLRSIKKIEWMQQRLTNNAFTSFWP